MMGGALTKVDIGHGRGWLAPAPAASLRRIDRQLGRLADINEAGRSPEQADKNRAAWLRYERYLNGGPWAPKAPYALGSDESVHCWGYAADTDDSYDADASAIWLDNGWIQTALYPKNPSKHEPWHREYRLDRDNHRFDPEPSSAGASIELLEDMMSSNPVINVVPSNGAHSSNGTIYIGLDDGSFEPLRPPFATNIRGIISVGLLGASDGSQDTIPTLSQPDFNALKAVWATMCKGRTDAAAVWAEGVHAQDADGNGLYLDQAGTITTTPTARPLKFTAAGFLASTNALATEAAESGDAG